MSKEAMKRFLIETSVENAEGNQTWYVDATSEAEALEQYEQGGCDLYASNVEATALGEPEISGETTLDDFGDFGDFVAQPAPATELREQEPVAYWIPKAEQFCIAGPSGRPFAKAWEPLYTSPPTLSLAQRPHECSRSHPHENMNAMCELRTEIARLTNQNARLKALHQGDEINTYRMTLLCIRDGLQQGMSKSIQKLQAREINDVLGLPSFASYRTSPPAQRTWQGLTDEEIEQVCVPLGAAMLSFTEVARAIEAKLKEKNT